MRSRSPSPTHPMPETAAALMNLTTGPPECRALSARAVLGARDERRVAEVLARRGADRLAARALRARARAERAQVRADVARHRAEAVPAPVRPRPWSGPVWSGPGPGPSRSRADRRPGGA